MYKENNFGQYSIYTRTIGYTQGVQEHEIPAGSRLIADLRT